MLAAGYASVVEDQSMKRNTIIRLKESVCNLLQNRKYVINIEWWFRKKNILMTIL